MLAFESLTLLAVGAVAAGAGAGARIAQCPSACWCMSAGRALQVRCEGMGLTAPPQGTWPHVSALSLRNNSVERLSAALLRGYPNLRALNLDLNPVSVLRLSDFVGSRLSLLSCSRCGLKQVLPLKRGQQLPTLSDLDLRDNYLRHTQPDWLEGLTNKELGVFLEGNPLVIPGGGPLFSSSNLVRLSLRNVDARAMTKETFKDLPKLHFIHITDGNVFNISEVFSNLRHLKILNLSNNPIKEIPRGFIAGASKLCLLNLSGAPLHAFDPSALSGARDLQLITIDDTPLACGCRYEDLYLWGMAWGVAVEARCGARPPCAFDARANPC